jgi:murein DD-endopeptidase MepM/ murein hydrolase activator NlpD
MAKGPDGDESARRHRPLPSVDMALLPHELRAARVRLATMVVLGVGLAVAIVGLSVARPWISELLQRDDGTSSDGWPERRANTARSGATHADCGRNCAGQGAEHVATARTSSPVNAGEEAEPPPIADLDAPPGAQSSAAAPSEPIAALAGSAPSPVASSPTPDGGDHIVQKFGQARGFRDAVVKAGASGADADALVAALDKLVDFRRAQPEDELVLDRDADKRLIAFEYHASVTERFRAERKPEGGFVGSKIKVDVEHRRIAKGGYISDSLGKALEAQGVRSNIAGAFVEAFEGRIDFKKHSRQGDSFKLILEEDYVDGQPLGYGRLHALHYKGERAGEAFAIWYEPDRNGGDFFDENGRAMHGGWLRTPLRYDHISSPYNLRRRHPILKRIVPHEGIDYAAPPGTPVWAAAEGTVTFVGPRGANGNLIALQHSGGYETFYAHLLRVASGLKRGGHVKQRQTIGQVGSTGRSTGPHLHFALKRNGHFVDPATQLNGPGKPLAVSELPKFKRAVVQLKREMAAIALAPAPAPAGDTSDHNDDFHEDPIDL